MLACDGFWDVMDGQEAVDHVLEFFEEGLTTTEIASKLGDLAIRFGSSDNVTVVVVSFVHHHSSHGGHGGEGEKPVHHHSHGGGGGGEKPAI